MGLQELGALARISAGTLPQALAAGWPLTDTWKRLIAWEVDLQRGLLQLEAVTGMPAEWWRPHVVAIWHEMNDPVPWEVTSGQVVDLMISWAVLGRCEWPSKWPDYALR